MVVQPHFTVPVNIRSKDRPIMDAALEIAKRENKQVTSIFREALAEYVQRRKLGEGSLRLESYLGPESVPITLTLEKVLVPSDLKPLSDPDLLSFAKRVRARAQELELELRKRGYNFRW
ncbi:MAG: hypothetical protein OK457_06315 [Thaumarchaeota archaeon]|nr:hypothetical protein [Nitrososphaerota archaeon]